MTPASTPHLDALAAEARAYLAAHWPPTDGDARSIDVMNRAALAAAQHATRLDPAHLTEQAERIATAWAELRDLAAGEGPAAIFAQHLVMRVILFGNIETGYPEIAAAVARFLTFRPDGNGLLDNVVDLVGGAEDLERQEW